MPVRVAVVRVRSSVSRRSWHLAVRVAPAARQRACGACAVAVLAAAGAALDLQNQTKKEVMEGCNEKIIKWSHHSFSFLPTSAPRAVLYDRRASDAGRTTRTRTLSTRTRV